MKPRKGVVPPQLRKYLFKRQSAARRPVMAKRRYYARAKAAVRRVYMGERRRVRRVYSTIRSTIGFVKIGMSFAYGYGRSYLVNNSVAQKVLSWIPFGGEYKTNIVLGLGAYLANWLFKPTNQYIRQALETMVCSEAFLAGSKMASGATLSDPQNMSYGGVLLN